MFTVAVVSTKGGVGKTTTAAHLGLALGARLVDADPTSEGSLASWARVAREAGAGFPEVVEAPGGMMPPGALDGGGFAMIDTAPGVTEGVADVVALANFLVLPTRPGRADIERTGAFARSLAGGGLRGLVLLTHARATTVTRSALRDLGELPDGFVLYPTTIPLAVRFESAYGTLPRDLAPYTTLASDLRGLSA
jgi:chromosome partitioning protein